MDSPENIRSRSQTLNSCSSPDDLGGSRSPISPVYVVIPAFNEATVIETTLEQFFGSAYRIVVVDDGSDDGTWNIVKSLPVLTVRHPVNLGQGAALQTGMTFSLRRGANSIVHFDADGQHRFEDIEGMLEPLRSGEAEVVLGSRFLRPLDSRSVPRGRRLLLKAGVLFNAALTGIWLSDSHNGLRAMTRSVAETMILQENRYAHASEILSQIRRLGIRWVEQPVRVSYSVYSLTKGQSAWNAINHVIDALVRWIWRQ